MGLFLQITQCVDESSIGGRRQFMETTTMTSLDPTSTLGIKGIGHCRYWLIGAWSKSKSPSIDF